MPINFGVASFAGPAIMLLFLKFYSSYMYSSSVALRPNAGQDLLILEISISHTTTHHSR